MRQRHVKATFNLKVNNSFEGLPLEYELVKVVQEKTPIDAISPIIYTERKDGVQPEYDIRTDKFLLAEESMAKAAQATIIQMEARENKKVGENLSEKTSGNLPNDAV